MTAPKVAAHMGRARMAAGGGACAQCDCGAVIAGLLETLRYIRDEYLPADSEITPSQVAEIIDAAIAKAQP